MGQRGMADFRALAEAVGRESGPRKAMLLIGSGFPNVYDVVDYHRALIGVAEPDHRLDAWTRRNPLPATPVVSGLLLARDLCRAHLIELLLRAVAVIRLALAEKLRDHLGITAEAPRLVVGTLVVIEAEPLQTFEDSTDHLFAGSLDVGVFDAEDEFAAGLAGEQPVEQCGTRPTDMQIARWRRREANTNI